MKAIFIIFTIVIFLFSLVSAQDTPIKKFEEAAIYEKPFYNWALKFAPLTLIDLANPHLQVGVEKNLGNRWSLQQEFGIKLPYDVNKRKYKGFKTSTEIRLHLQPYNKPFNIFRNPHFPYLAFECVFMKRNFEEIDEREEVIGNPPQFTIIETIIPIRQNILVTNLKYGFQSEIGDDIFLDFFVGIGLRFFFEKHFAGDGTINSLEEGAFIIPMINRAKGAGEIQRSSLALGFKITRLFW